MIIFPTLQLKTLIQVLKTQQASTGQSLYSRGESKLVKMEINIEMRLSPMKAIDQVNSTRVKYKHLNAEFQRIERRDKKAFVSDQCKEIEENNRMGKTKDLFKKIRDTKGNFHEKMGLIKDRNGMDLTEAEDIKKRWQEYTEELYKKIFMTQIITMM